jgi:ribosomal protein S18 acetylase RimI-like enzyme
MIRTARESQLVVRRARLLRRLAPIAALAATGMTYGLHHTTPLDGHDLSVMLLFIAAGVAVVFAARAATAERRLPVVVTLQPGGANLRAARIDDLDFCTALHAETLPHGFFAELGHLFLRAYLATFVSSPHAVALLLTVHDAPVGMVVGVLRPQAHRQWVLRRRGFLLAILGTTALATRPRLALRFARTRIAHYRRAWRRRRNPATTQLAGQPAVLSHIAVAPGAEGAGFGRQLVEAFVEAARDAGSQRVVLATLAGKAGAAGFYRKQGWSESEPRLNFDGQSMIIFSLALPPEEQ